ncbi:MAG: mechanosensitive ion channel domain-containing protein [Bacteroidota bacterium]
MRYFLLLLACTIALQVIARQDTLQKEEDVPSVNLSTPYHAIYTFLSNLQDEQYFPANSAQVFSAQSPGEAAAVAVQLKQVLDGEGIYVNLEDIPKRKNYYDSSLRRSRYILTEVYPDIYLEKRDQGWVFPPASVRMIKQKHEEVFGYGMSYLLEWLPKIGTRKIAGLHSWQLVAILIIILLSFVLHKILTLIFEKIILAYLRKSKYSELADHYVGPVARPLSVFLITSLILLFVPVLQLPIVLAKYLVISLKIIAPVFLTVVCYRLVDLLAFYFNKLASKTQSSLDDQLVPLVSKALRVFIVVIGVFVILLRLNVDILPLLTGLSIGGLAFALAAQDTIKNFFGSLMIFVDKPFQIGDWITSGDIDGTVEEVGFRSTRVRTFRNSVVYVPNGKLADSTIDNHGLRAYRRFFTQIAVTYDTPTQLIEVYVAGLRKIVDKHPNTRKDYYEIYLNEMAGSSLNIMFYIFFEVPSWSDELKARHEVILQIIDLANTLGVNFAFPTQTIQVETLPGQMSLSPTYPNSREELEQKMIHYIERSGTDGAKND